MQLQLAVFPVSCKTLVLNLSLSQGIFPNGNSNMSGKLCYYLSHSKMPVHHVADRAFLLQQVSCPINNVSSTLGQNPSSTHHQWSLVPSMIMPFWQQKRKSFCPGNPPTLCVCMQTDKMLHFWVAKSCLVLSKINFLWGHTSIGPSSKRMRQ